jgi:hypothetical protein
MTTKDYAKLDEQIIQAIKSGITTYNGLCAKLDEPAKMFLVNPSKPTHRVIDRRLQAIKQRGLISFSRKEGWKILGKTCTAETTN